MRRGIGILIAFLMMMGCGGKQSTAMEQSGLAEVRIDSVALLSAGVDRVSIESAGISQDLQFDPSSDTFNGTLILPVGTQVLVGRAFAQDTQIGVSNPTQAEIRSGEVTRVMLRILDATGNAPPLYGPIVDSLTYPATARAGVPVTLSIAVVAPGGDPVTYDWTSDCQGAVFSAPSAATTTWSAPAPAACAITVTAVATASRLSVTQHFLIVVLPADSDSGAAAVSGVFVRAPLLAISLPGVNCAIFSGGNSSCPDTIASPTTTPYTVAVAGWGVSTPGSIEVSDDCGGEFGSPSQGPNFIAGSWLPPTSGGLCIVTARAVNGDGVAATLTAAVLTHRGVARNVATVSGTVTNSAGAAVPGATVTLSTGSVQVVTRTDPAGRYTIDVAHGTYSVDVAYDVPGFSTQGRNDVRGLVIASDMVHDVSIPDVVVDGRVIDTAGEPVPGAYITALAFAQNACCGGFDTLHGDQAPAGPDGSFRIRVLPGSYFSVTVVPPADRGGYVVTTAPGIDLRADTSLSFTIARGVAVSGSVVYADGTPAAAATVHFSGGSTDRAASTDSAGHYTVVVEPAVYNVSIAYDVPGFSTQGRRVAAGVAISADAVRDWTVPDIILQGRVIDDAGAPVPGATVEALAFADNACCGGFDVINRGNAVVAGPDGGFLVRVLPGSYFQVQVVPPVGSTAYVTTPVPDLILDRDTSRDFVIARPVTVHGHIHFASDGSPVRDGTVHLVSAGVQYTVALAPDGAYAVSVAPGTYGVDVAFATTGFSTQGRRVDSSLEVQAETVADYAVPDMILDVRVQNSLGLPVAGVEFTAIAFARNGCCGGFDAINGLRTASDGTAHYRILPGAYLNMALRPLDGSGYLITSLPDQTFEIGAPVQYTIAGDASRIAVAGQTSRVRLISETPRAVAPPGAR